MWRSRPDSVGWSESYGNIKRVIISKRWTMLKEFFAIRKQFVSVVLKCLLWSWSLKMRHVCYIDVPVWYRSLLTVLTVTGTMVQGSVGYTVSRLHFSGRYKRSDWRFCACAINVKSSMCSEPTKHFWYKCHVLFVNSSVMNTVKSCFKRRSIQYNITFV